MILTQNELLEDVKHGTWDYPFQVHHTVLQDGLHLYPHAHEEIEITVITKGEGTFCINRNEYKVKPLDAVVIEPNAIHLAQPIHMEDAEFFSMVFSPRFLSESRDTRIYQKCVAPVLEHKVRLLEHLDGSKEWQIRFVEKAQEIRELYEKGEQELMCQIRVLELWQMLLDYGIESSEKQTFSAGNVFLNQSIRYIHENYEKKITTKQLAELLHMSEGHFSRLFKDYMKMSPIEYLIHHRVRVAATLLENTDLSIGDISLKCGFNDFSYFGQKFKEIMKCTPREYRKK